jgi:hypothetical protein
MVFGLFLFSLVFSLIPRITNPVGRHVLIEVYIIFALTNKYRCRTSEWFESEARVPFAACRTKRTARVS